MAENDMSLDSFISTPETKAQTENVAETVNLEDEFAKLLNDFIGQDNKTQTQKAPPAAVAEPQGLDSFITPTNVAKEDKAQETTPSADGGLDSFITPTTARPEAGAAETSTVSVAGSEAVANETNGLKTEEYELARAMSNFQDGIYSIADKKNLKVPQTEYTDEMLKPNYKPSVGKKIAQYLLDCWDLINKADPENIKRLPKSANDEKYLAFAETLSDTDMQLAIISYVEILINLEICEVKYEQKKEIIQKNRIKKELYEEYMELQERKALFIQKLKEKNFPINVERLINNYFKVAQKDPDGSFEALTKNPAMFSPIEVDKIHPKFFGLIKVTPEDGIKANQKIGKFIKNLKV